MKKGRQLCLDACKIGFQTIWRLQVSRVTNFIYPWQINLRL